MNTCVCSLIEHTATLASRRRTGTATVTNSTSVLNLQALAMLAISHHASSAEPVAAGVNFRCYVWMQLMHVVGRGKIRQPTGVVLTCTAAGVVKTPLMRVQEPFAALLNSITPNAKLVPRLVPEQLCVSDEAVCPRLPLPDLYR